MREGGGLVIIVELEFCELHAVVSFIAPCVDDLEAEVLHVLRSLVGEGVFLCRLVSDGQRVGLRYSTGC